MKHRTRSVVLAAAVAFASLSLAGPVPTADAYFFILFPFPPIADCGTVIIVDQTIPFPDGDPEGGCLAWKADSGGVFLVGGLDAFEPGDRVFVEGQICNTCLTTCAATAILNGQISACP